MTEAINRLRESVASVFLGNAEAIDRAICCLLARGHLLIEDVPGVGKTMLAMALARSLDCSFSRIQLTPDLLPSDVLGVSVFNRDTGKFEFKHGPIFANVVLADEVNRTSPRTQSALLEAMNEATVSIDGHMHALEPPFMVVATQNPLEFEGAYPLPENQLDRFLMRIHLGYPSKADEARVLELRPSTSALHEMQPVVAKRDVLEMQRRVDAVRLEPSLAAYIIELATLTRHDDELRIGLSPRGALALAQAARATAFMRGRDYCVPDDLLSNVLPVCAHRVIPAYHNAASGNGDGAVGGAGTHIMRRVVESLPSPV